MKIYSLIRPTLPPEIENLQTLAIVIIIGIIIHRHYVEKYIIHNSRGSRTFFYCFYVIIIWVAWIAITGPY